MLTGRPVTHVLWLSVLAAGATIALRAQGTPAVQTGQAPPAAFRSRVDIVDVDVSVLDRNRLPVTGLVAEDFEVFENGERRPIVAFGAVDLPTRVLPPARWMASTAPDLATNAVPSEGRLVTILMNRSITAEQYPVARSIAAAAIDQLAPGDLAAVVFATHGIPQNFTADRRLLLNAINRPFAVLPEGDSGEAGDCFCGTCSLESIVRVAESLQTIRHRRRLMIIIGSNLSVQTNGTCGGALKGLRDRATTALETANVTVYTFDPAGLTTLANNAGNRTPLNPSQAAMAALVRRGNLQFFPDRTGGRAVFSANEPEAQMSNVFRESRSYYVLGFEPASLSAKGRVESIEVKVARRGVTVQARRGFVAGRGEAPASRPNRHEPVLPPVLRDAVSGLWPRTDLALNMQATVWALPGLENATVAVVVGVDGTIDAARTAAGSDRNRTADVLVGAFDRNGRLMASTRQSISGLPAAADGRVTYEVSASLPLRTGRYEIRAAVDDGQSGTSGSVYGYAEVPDFRATPVTLSGIVLQAEPRGVPTVGAALTDLMPFVPTTRRAFTTTDRVMAFAREQQGTVRTLVPGYLDARILDATDQQVFHHEERLTAEAFGANRATNLSLELPLARLGPGEYLLTIEARHGNERVSRDVWFSVR